MSVLLELTTKQIEEKMHRIADKMYMGAAKGIGACLPHNCDQCLPSFGALLGLQLNPAYPEP